MGLGVFQPTAGSVPTSLEPDGRLPSTPGVHAIGRGEWFAKQMARLCACRWSRVMPGRVLASMAQAPKDPGWVRHGLWVSQGPSPSLAPKSLSRQQHIQHPPRCWADASTHLALGLDLRPVGKEMITSGAAFLRKL